MHRLCGRSVAESEHRLSASALHQFKGNYMDYEETAQYLWLVNNEESRETAVDEYYEEIKAGSEDE